MISPSEHNLKATHWRLAVNFRARRPNLEAHLHAVQRVSMKGQHEVDQFIPIRFVFTNKLGRDDQLQLAFDRLVLSNLLSREVNLGIIIYGTAHAICKINISPLEGDVRRRIAEIEALLSSPAPPDLVLNRRCAECEFQARCRQEAKGICNVKTVPSVERGR